MSTGSELSGIGSLSLHRFKELHFGHSNEVYLIFALQILAVHMFRKLTQGLQRLVGDMHLARPPQPDASLIAHSIESSKVDKYTLHRPNIWPVSDSLIFKSLRILGQPSGQVASCTLLKRQKLPGLDRSPNVSTTASRQIAAHSHSRKALLFRVVNVSRGLTTYICRRDVSVVY